MAKLDLPTNERELVDALDAELIPAEQEAMVHSTSHKLVDAYLAGARKFRIRDRFTGGIDSAISFENARGELEMRWEEITKVYLAEVGRFLKMDIFPTAAKKGESLGAMRKAAIAKATLGSLVAPMPLDRIKQEMIIAFLKHGTVGITHIETGLDHMPDAFEVVPARQLRGIPAWVDGVGNLMGIARKRWAPLGWLRTKMKEVYDKKIKTSNAVGDLGARDVPWGSAPPEESQSRQGTYGASGAAVGSGGPFISSGSDVIGTDIGKNLSRDSDSGAPKKDGRMYVPVEEIYIYDDTTQFVARFIIKVGRKILLDENYEKQGVQVLCPLHVARHTDIGKFFARGFVAPLIPMNDQIEKLMASVFKNIQELDNFGMLVIPGSANLDIKKFKTGPRPKAISFDPDPMNPDLKPFSITPQNSGLLPVRAAEFAGQQLSKLSGQGPIFQGETSGRVDSAAGLGFLFNTGNISLALPANGLAAAFSGVYARLLQAAKDRLGPGKTIEIATIDDAIAGVVIDPQTGEMRLSENPIPEPWTVTIDVRDRQPKDREILKQELKEGLSLGTVDPVRYWVTAFEENLEIPGAPKEIWETWRKAIWQIILLFRDGVTPGNVDIGEHTQQPDIQLIKLNEFMSKIEFSLASEEVRTAFETWKMDLEILAGTRFPSELPPPEEAAEVELAQQQQAQQQQAQPPGPGGGQF